MKVLIVGGGGREHALAWKLKKDDAATELLAAPGNPGVATLAQCFPIAASDIAGILTLANTTRPDLTVIGPEAPLAAGLADRLREHGHRVFGPSAAAAQIEASKRFAKELMLGARVPTAHASWHRDAASAKRAAHQMGAPVVIKASGLAAGKGVIVCHTLDESDRAIDSMLLSGSLGESGSEVLVEEFMEGEELSLFAITDGESFLTMLPAQDHKRLNEGDEGPNTGGMGAYAPVSMATPQVVARVEREIISPTLAALRERETPFSGLLYAGLMLTREGPKVVEFNCRFGDPETQVVLPLMSSVLLPLLSAASEHGGLSGAAQLNFSSESAVTTVVASPGYPDSPQTGAAIDLTEPPTGSILFHAGTRREDGRLLTAGGRVIAATGVARDFVQACHRSLQAAESVRFPNAHFRRDIGWRERARRAGTP